MDAPLVIASTDLLHGLLDFDALLPEHTPSLTVKGMFFTQRVAALGGLDRYVDKLVAPPRMGRYVPFSDYPTRDYFYLLFRTAEKRYAALGPRQGIRQLARDDLRIFGDSVLGRVMLNVLPDARHTLLAAPRGFGMVVKGMSVEATETGPRSVRMAFYEKQRCWEYNLGQVEGMAASHGGSSICTVHFPRSGELVIDVELIGP